MAGKSLDWDAHINQPVRIYRNLGNGKMSIQAKTAVGWRVVGHVTDCVIRNVTFIVKETARQRVIRDRQKNVHAWGEGVLIGHLSSKAIAPLRLSYDPYIHSSFVDGRTGIAVTSCSLLVVKDNQVFMSQDALSVDAPRRTPGDRLGMVIGDRFYQFQPIAS